MKSFGWKVLYYEYFVFDAELDHTKLDAALFEKGTLFIRGKDVFGKKLLIFKAKHHQKGTMDMDQLQKFIVYYFERIERWATIKKMVFLFSFWIKLLCGKGII